METTVVDRLFIELTELKQILKDRGEISLYSSADENFKKSLLLAAASYFDYRLRHLLLLFFAKHTPGSTVVSEFAKNTVINSRQYHSLFEWETKNANKFYRLFGDGFKTFMRKRETDLPKFTESVEAFLEIGRDRNRLVHQNFAAYVLEKDASEIYEIYKKAQPFVEDLSSCLEEYVNNMAAERAQPSGTLGDIP